MQKKLECKWTSWTMNYISGSNVHWRIGGKQSCGAAICGSTSNVEGHKGGRHCWGENVAINKSADIDRSATKCDGNQYECAKGYKNENTCNYHGHSHTSRQRYLHSRSWPIYVDTDQTKLW